MGYRRLTADDWFVGAQISPPPGGEPLNFEIHTVDLNATFAVTERFNLTLTVPFISGKLSAKVWPDGIRHTQSSSGVGDVSLVGSMWLQNPATHSEGNVALGLGVKAATGSNTVSSPYYTATGPVPFTALQGIEPGDGGWGIILQAQAYRKVFRRAFAYASASYLISPRALSGVAARSPGDSSWSVPDIYSGRLGLAYALWPDEGISVSLGGRIDGLPVPDPAAPSRDSPSSDDRFEPALRRLLGERPSVEDDPDETDREAAETTASGSRATSSSSIRGCPSRGAEKRSR